MDEVGFAELGDVITQTTSVEGHNIMTHAWGDKVRKCFVSTPFQETLLTNGDGGKWLTRMEKRQDKVRSSTKQ